MSNLVQRMRQYDLHHSYAHEHWLEKRIWPSADIQFDHSRKVPHPCHRVHNHNQEMRRSYHYKVSPRVPADLCENRRQIYPAMQRFDE